MQSFTRAGKLRRLWTAGISVLLAGSGLGILALSGPSIPTPTITAAPANPTNQTSAAFTYTDTKNGVTFQCALESISSFGPCGSTRPSSKSYNGPLAEGSHVFYVKALFQSEASAVASYSWIIDRTTPTVLSISLLGPTPTNASSVSWRVVFSEAVTGVDAGDFTLVKTGTAGNGSSLSSVSGSGYAYTVAASTGSGNGMLGLNLVDNNSIHDLAGNPLGGSALGDGNFTGQKYTIDKDPPAAPVITQHPDDPSATPDATFGWTGETGAYFQCSRENGSWQPCASPLSYTVTDTNNGLHQFAVRALDAAGNISPAAQFNWKVSNAVFSISGVVIDGGGHNASLYPGLLRHIAITLTNPNTFKIYVTSVTVAVSGSPPGCSAGTNIELHQSHVSSSHTVMVPAHGTATLAVADRPDIRLLDLSTNQDLCKRTTFSLSFTGTATH